MKKSLKILLTLVLITFSAILYAQPPAPNNGNGMPGGGNTPVGGGAPIGSGIAILMALGVAYGGKKVYSEFN
jgi:hypothetical protein